MKTPAVVRIITAKPRLSAFLILGAVSFIAYGLIAPWVGFYGDDWGYIWLLFKGQGLQLFLSHSRPGFIPVYNFLALILGSHPLPWQIFMLLLHWVNAFVFWLLLDKIWSDQCSYTLTAASLLIVYPGFMLNEAAVNISMFIILLTCFLFSGYLNLRFLDGGKYRWLLLAVGLAFSTINITFAEYFYFMELVRPVLIFLYLSPRNMERKQTIRTGLLAWAPYLFVFSGTLVWRMLFQSKLNGYYTLKLVADFKSAPMQTIVAQLKQIGADLWNTGPGAWINALAPIRLLQSQHLPDYEYYLAEGLLILIAALVCRILISRRNPQPKSIRMGLVWIVTGLTWCLISGWSIWLAELRLTGEFTTSRFSMPFMPGMILILTGILILFQKYKPVQIGLTAVLIGSAIAFQLLVGNSYRMDWQRQKSFFYQLYWRFPGLKPGTLLYLSNPPTNEGEENSISAALNWVYSPQGEGKHIDYYAYFIPEKYIHDTAGIQSGKPVLKGHLIGDFTTNQENILAIDLDSRNCIRVLNPKLDPYNGHLDEFTAQMASFSNPVNALAGPSAIAAPRLSSAFGTEPAHDWCWLYQQADLARQEGDWQKIVSSAGSNLHPQDYRQDWQKLSVFVEAYAHTGDFDQAARLLKTIHSFSPKEQTVYCKMTAAWLIGLNPQGDFLQEIQTGRSKMNCTGN